MKNSFPLAATGRERSCTQCGSTYRAPRASSRYCSTRCRVRNHTGSRKGRQSPFAPLRAWLLRRGFAGKLSPWDGRNRAGTAERLGLTVPLSFLLAELAETVRRIEASGLRPALPAFTEDTLKAALAALGLDHRFPDAIQRQLRRA